MFKLTLIFFTYRIIIIQWFGICFDLFIHGEKNQKQNNWMFKLGKKESKFPNS